MNYDDLTLQAGLGSPPDLPSDTPIFNVSRIQSCFKCEHRYDLDYVQNIQYAPERTTNPPMWLGTTVHRWIERLHKHGWDSDLEQFIQTEHLSVPEDYDPDKWSKVLSVVEPLCATYRDHWLDRQSYDRIFAAEQKFWVLWEGVCFLGTFDGIVEMSGKLYDFDTKTSSRSVEDVTDDQRNSVQRLIYAEALDRLAGPVYGLPFGGAVIDYVSTVLPLKPSVPRMTKLGEIHKTDARIIGEYAGKLADYKSFGLARITDIQLRSSHYRVTGAYQFGLFSTVRTAEAIRRGILDPKWSIGLNSWGCKGCPHHSYCAAGTSPDKSDYYTREPDYVDLARKGQ